MAPYLKGSGRSLGPEGQSSGSSSRTAGTLWGCPAANGQETEGAAPSALQLLQQAQALRQAGQRPLCMSPGVGLCHRSAGITDSLSAPRRHWQWQLSHKRYHTPVTPNYFPRVERTNDRWVPVSPQPHPRTDHMCSATSTGPSLTPCINQAPLMPPLLSPSLCALTLPPTHMARLRAETCVCVRTRVCVHVRVRACAPVCTCVCMCAESSVSCQLPCWSTACAMSCPGPGW